MKEISIFFTVFITTDLIKRIDDGDDDWDESSHFQPMTQCLLSGKGPIMANYLTAQSGSIPD